MATLSINSDNVIELRRLKDAVTGSAVTSATVNVTLVNNTTGAQVAGATWPLSMTHIDSGTYRATLPDTLSLDSRYGYTATVVADDGPGRHKEWCVSYTIVCNE